MGYHYDEDHVLAMLRRPGSGGIREWARSVGQANAGSVQSQHEAAAEFFEIALALQGNDALGQDDREFAEAEIRRHRAALPPSEPHPPVGGRSQPKAV
jgi:hypothetical protein